SSRRRHTRFSRDWSSDVCSSDLRPRTPGAARSMCGIVGIVSSSPVNQQVYDALSLLQHRGQDSTGIATAEGSIIHMFKAKGQVREAYRTRDMRSLIGTMGLGHVRYATRG